jgi:hypothetical protein
MLKEVETVAMLKGIDFRPEGAKSFWPLRGEETTL